MEKSFPVYMYWTSRLDHATTFSGIGCVEDGLKVMAILFSTWSVLTLEALSI